MKTDTLSELVSISDSPEMLAIKILTHQKPVRIASCYQTPKNFVEETQKLSLEMRKLTSKCKNSPSWIGGNFNLPEICWQSKSVVKHQYSIQVNVIFHDSLDTIIPNKQLIFQQGKMYLN